MKNIRILDKCLLNYNNIIKIQNLNKNLKVT